MKKIILILVIIVIASLGVLFLFNRNLGGNGDLNIIKQSSTLNLSGQGITSLKAEIFNNNTNVKFLDLSNNNLTGSIPAEIRKMKNLEELDASHNNLTGIPAEIGQLLHLKKIDFSYNKLDTMPNEIINLKNNLKEFNLTGNKYSQSQIDDLKTKLPNTNIIY